MNELTLVSVDAETKLHLRQVPPSGVIADYIGRDFNGERNRLLVTTIGVLEFERLAEYARFAYATGEMASYLVGGPNHRWTHWLAVAHSSGGIWLSTTNNLGHSAHIKLSEAATLTLLNRYSELI